MFTGLVMFYSNITFSRNGTNERKSRPPKGHTDFEAVTFSVINTLESDIVIIDKTFRCEFDIQPRLMFPKSTLHLLRSVKNQRNLFLF